MIRAAGLDARVRVAQLPDDVVLTRQEVADWLGIKPRQVERLGIPVLNLGRKSPRYLKRDVSAWIESQRRPGRDQPLKRAS